MGGEANTVYIFGIDGTLKHTLSGSSRSYGGSVAIDSDYALIGESGNPEQGANAGAAYLFNLATETTTKLLAPDGTSQSRFGSSVAIDNGFAIIGARGDDHDVFDDAGSAYIFDVATGDFLAKLIAPEHVGNARFGASVGVSGSAFIAGGPGALDESRNRTGTAYVFERQSDDPGPTVVPTPTAGAAGLLMLGLLATMSRPRRNQRET